MEASVQKKKVIEYVGWGLGIIIGSVLLFFALLWFINGQSPATVFKTVTVDEIIAEFNKEGLDAKEATELPQKEFGNIREEGKRFLVPHLGKDQGGRIYKFKNKEDLEKAKNYYDELGNNSPILFSHTYAKGKYLLQMNGQMKDDEFYNYKIVMDNLIK